MKLKEISIYQYLSKEEALELVSVLDSNGIKSFCHPMANGDGIEIYQVFVSESDLKDVVKITDKYNVVLELKKQDLKMFCSKCRSRPPVTEVKRKEGFWERLYTIGTQIVFCNKCGNKWFI